jgi:hypothetical protein
MLQIKVNDSEAAKMVNVVPHINNVQSEVA